MPNNALQKISKRAKQLKRIHPNMPWKSLIKKASAEYRKGSIGSASKVGTKKKIKKSKKVTGVFNRSGKIIQSGYSNSDGITSRVAAGLTVSAAKHFLRQEYKDLLGKTYVKRSMATTKTEKKNHSRHISELTRALKNLDK